VAVHPRAGQQADENLHGCAMINVIGEGWKEVKTVTITAVSHEVEQVIGKGRVIHSLFMYMRSSH
jgi:hypothetical protein